MINVYPHYEQALHIMNNSCCCNPSIIFGSGVMIVVHNELVKSLPVQEAIKENTESLYNLYSGGEITVDEIKSYLKQAIEEEEYEIAMSVKEVLTRICFEPLRVI